jgi:beta-phosphoglucomutase
MTATGVIGTAMPAIEVGGIPGVRAVIFDFNGTITNDEDLQYFDYAGTVAAELGVRLERAFFSSTLCGLGDPDMFQAIFERYGLGRAEPEVVEELCRRRLERYVERSRATSPVRPGAAALIRGLSPSVPMAVVSSAPRAEVAPVLTRAGLCDFFVAILTGEDVVYSKPHPEGFLLALERLGAGLADLRAEEVLVFEDSPYGIAAARDAGMRCIAVHVRDRVAAAEADVICDVMDDSLLAAVG